ncbi:hypothetical protein ES705_42156 [subsurface metagenome]
MRGTCSICGEVIRSRRSDKNSARANFLKAVRKHQWKRHRNTMIARIKAGKAKAKLNPSIQDMVSALKEGPRASLKIYRKWTERQYQHMKSVMDAIEELLPLEVQLAWTAIEAFHDEFGP